MFTVFIKDYKINALVGIYPEDKNIQTALVINAEIKLSAQKIELDEIGNTISYDIIIEQIKKQSLTHVNLLEIFAQELAEFCLSHDLSQSVRIEIVKNKIYAEGNVGIVFEKTKD